MTHELPQFLRDLLATPPAAGGGVHNWLYRASRQLHAHLPAGEIVNLLEKRVRDCGRHVSRKEIVDAVKNALSVAWQPHGTGAAVQTVSKWPKVNKEQRAAITLAIRADAGRHARRWQPPDSILLEL